MNRRTLAEVLVCGLFLAGCSDEARPRNAPQVEGTRARVEEMSREHSAEMAERQASREQHQAANAREDLAEQRGDLAEARRDQDSQRAINNAREDVQEARSDVREESQELAAATAKACGNIPVAEQQACPVGSASIASVEDIRNGVKVHLASNVSNEDAVERRITCHNARRELERDRAIATGQVAAALPRTACFTDVRGVDTDVDEEDGRVTVSVTTRDDQDLNQVRALARQGVRNAPPLRTTSGSVDER